MKTLIFWIAAVVLLTAASDAAAKKTDPELDPAFCEMLGMTEEYISRHYPDSKPTGDGFVERFYPAEEKLARRFKKLAARFGKRINERFRLKRQGSTNFQYHSHALARRIDALYTTVEGVFTLDSKKITGASKACRLRYVAGAHRRFGEGSNVITVANGSFKIETLAQVLRTLGSEKVLTGFTRTTPAANKVFFSPTPALKKALELKTIVTEEEFRKTPHLELIKRKKRGR